LKDKKIVHVVGARPNFVKAAPVIHSIKNLMPKVTQVLVHTGQHYDKNLSDVFFTALDMPKPDVNLKIGSSKAQGKQVADVIVGIEKYLSSKDIDLVIVYGDVNSTLGAAIAAVKMGIPVAHIESGLRSFDRDMPEEINRMIVDKISNYHFVTEESGVENLLKEGHSKSSIYHVGNTMIDSLYKVLGSVPEPTRDYDYILATLHRPSNVDNKDGLQKILDICRSVDAKIVFPMHPRTKNNFGKFGLLDKLSSTSNVEVIEPVGYFEFVSLMKNSMAVLTDSGGIQEETTALGVPCITLRKNTERPSTITEGTNMLVDSVDEVLKRSEDIKSDRNRNYRKPHLWDGKAGERIATVIRTILEKEK
jgi:UDP-N-acetylglucosamine 2-epimerase (non-hydrolysing)